MWRRSLDGLRFDIVTFIGRNRIKFIIAFSLSAAGFIFGLINALARVTTDEAMLAVKGYDIVRMSLGERGFFGYWMGRFFLHLFLVALLALFGVRELLSYLSYLVLVIYAYQYAFFIGAVFCYAGLTALPVMLACIIPMFLIGLCILTYFGVFILFFAHNSKIGRWNEFSYYLRCVKVPILCALAAVFLASLIESILAALLTAAIVL